MKYTTEWVKEKCFEIMKTIFDGDIKPEQVKWNEEEAVMKMLIKLPQKLIKNNGLFEVLKEKYGKDTYNNQCRDEQEVDVYINNVDFQIFIYEGELIVRLYYCLECNNCNKYEKCDGKTYSWETLNYGKPTCYDYEEKEEQKTNYEKFDTILKEINKDEYENYSSKTELMTIYLADYKKIRDIITKNFELVESAVDKNTSTEYYKLVDHLIDTIDYKTGYINDLEEKISELEEKNKKLSRECFAEVNDKNVFRNQIKEHLKEMDLICKAH